MLSAHLLCMISHRCVQEGLCLVSIKNNFRNIDINPSFTPLKVTVNFFLGHPVHYYTVVHVTELHIQSSTAHSQ